MRIAVLGSGSVGRTVAARLAGLDHDVTIGTRDPQVTAPREEYAAWAATAPGVRLATFADAASSADLLVNASGGTVSLEVLRRAGAADRDGTVLLDISNPLDFSAGFPPTLTVKDTDSLAEQIQREFPGLRVVKALNTLTAELMVHPDTLPEPTTVFVCGDDADARATVTAILESFGHADVLDLGDLSSARGAEMFLPLWLRIMGSLGTASFNIRVVR